MRRFDMRFSLLVVELRENASLLFLHRTDFNPDTQTEFALHTAGRSRRCLLLGDVAPSRTWALGWTL